MSVSIDIRNLRNQSDKERKLKDYKEYLKLQQKLNTESDIAYKALAKGQTMGLKPQPAMKKYGSAEEALADITEQKMTALNHLRTIFPYGDDATKVLDQLDPNIPIGSRGSELTTFNQNWEDIKNELKGKTNVSPNYFNSIWDRYKEKLAKTNQTGIQIPIDDTTFNTRINELQAGIQTNLNTLRTQSRISGQMFNQFQRAISTMIQNRDQTKLEDLFDALDERNESRALRIIGAIQTSEKSETATSSGEVKAKLLILQNQLSAELEKAGYKKDGRGSYGRFPWDNEGRTGNWGELRKAGTATVEEVLNYWKKRNSEEAKGETAQERAQALARQGLANPPRPASATTLPPSPPPTLTKEQLKQLKQSPQYNTWLGMIGLRGRPATPEERAQKLQELASSQGSTPFASPLREGVGLKYIQGKSVQGFRHHVIYGRGIQKSTAERYREFGKYVIHIPSLKKSILNLKFKSRGFIPQIPNTLISEDFREMIENILENQRLPVHIFNKLSKNEQKLFEKVAQMAEIDDVLGIKVDNSENKEALKRFEILRGQLLAGNDNEEIRKELKAYILRFMNENIIPRKEGMNILMEMACLA